MIRRVMEKKRAVSSRSLFLGQFFPALFEKCFGGLDALFFRELSSFVFDANPTVVFVVEHDLERLLKVGFGFLPGIVEIMGLGRYSLGKWHELFEALVAIVAVEVSEIGKRAAFIETDVAKDFGHPFSIGRKPAVVLHDDVDLVILGKGGQGGEAFDAVECFFVVGRAFSM